MRFTRPASAPRSPERSCTERDFFCEPNVRGLHLGRAEMFLTGDIAAVEEVDTREVHKARE